MTTYLITGGGGFIGSHLAEALIGSGHRVRVLDNLSTGKRSNLALIPDCELIIGDASNPDSVRSAVRGVDGVFHLAAVPSVARSMDDPLGNQRNGELATAVVLSEARAASVRRVVYSSSAAVYGEPARLPQEENDPTTPASFYGVSKLASEHYIRVFARNSANFDAVSLRYFNVFGARQDPASPYSGVISIFLDHLKRGVRPAIFGDGLQTRDFVDVSNVVLANVLAMSAPGRLDGISLNIGTSVSVSLLDLWKHMCQLSGVDLAPRFEPPRVADVKHSCPSIVRAGQVLGYAPCMDWKTGIQDLWESVK